MNGEAVFTAIFAAAFLVYFSLFLVIETEIGTRLGILWSLYSNPSIYWAYWTGSPSGSIAFLDRWPVIVGLLFHLGLAFGWGRFAVVISGVRCKGNRLVTAALLVGIGLSLLSTYIFLLGCIQLYRWKLVCIAPAVFIAILGWIRKPPPEESVSIGEMLKEKEGQRDFRIWIGIACLPFALFLLSASMIPAWEFDVREYHLQVPKEWMLDGGVSFLPHNVYGNMPLGTEMHALLAMLYSFGERDWWWGGLIGKTVSGAYSVLTAVLLLAIGQRLVGKIAGYAAAFLYLSTPWTVANSIIGYNEGALAFYLVLSVWLFIVRFDSSNARNMARPVGGGMGLGFLLGIALGSAASCKYTGVVFVTLPGGILFLLMSLRNPISTVSIGRVTSLFLLGVAVTCGGWFLKNVVVTGNPVYPLAESVFSSGRTSRQVEQWENAHSPNSNTPWQRKLQDTAYSLSFSFKWIGPIVFPFFCCSLFWIRKDVRLRWIVFYLMFAGLVWLFVTHGLMRFLLPFFPLVCLMGGVGVGIIRSLAWKWVSTVVLLLGLLFGLTVSTSRMVGDVRCLCQLKYLDPSRLTAQDYSHPDGHIAPLNHLSREVAWLNENHPDSKVLFYGEFRPFYAEFSCLYNTCFDDCLTWMLFTDQGPNELRKQLHTRDIEFILVNPSELNRALQSYGYNVSANGSYISPADIDALTGNLLEVVTFEEQDQGSSVRLYRVLPEF